MHAHIKVADYAAEHKLKLQTRDDGQPLFKRALLSETADVWPIVETQYRAVCKAWRQLTQTAQRWFIHTAIDAHISEFLRRLSVGAMEAGVKGTFD